MVIKPMYKFNLTKLVAPSYFLLFNVSDLVLVAFNLINNNLYIVCFQSSEVMVNCQHIFVCFLI